MEIKRIKKCLLENRNVLDLYVKELTYFNRKNYESVAFFKLYINDELSIPIAVGFPKNWELVLFDFYWNSEDFYYIPHIDSTGKFCLFDLEGALIDIDFDGLLNQCLEKVREIVLAGISGINKVDFLKEFNSYFTLLPKCRKANIVFPHVKKSKRIYFCENKNNIIFASNIFESFNDWNRFETRKNGLYIYLEPTCPIYPPDYRNCNFKDFLNDVFKFVSVNDLESYKTKLSNEYLILFEIKQPNGIFNSFAALLKEPQYDLKNGIKLLKCRDCFPVFVEKLNRDYLLSRSSQNDNLLAKKKILLVGCGSIGGYVFHNLIKSGCRNITLVDYDLLKPENIYRHLLGIEYLYNFKTKALVSYGKKNLPNLKIDEVHCSLQDAIYKKKIQLEEFDFVISAVGNHNLNRWINRFVEGEKIVRPIFYVWNEPLDIGSHVAIIEYNKNGCYEDFFGRTEKTELYDKTSYCKKNQKFTKTFSGCAGSFIPYGSLVSMKSAILLTDILKDYTENGIDCNILVSEKGCDYYFKKAGFELSEKYENQTEVRETLEIKSFADSTCEICGFNSDYN